MKLLIAVNTCHKPAYRARAQAQRDTWVPALRAMGHDVVFFLGQPTTPTYCGPDEEGTWELYEGKRLAEVWFAGLDDSYAGICRKVQRICRWAKNHHYDAVLKIDDDVYIVPQRFQWLQVGSRHYVGRFRGPYGNYPPHFASGFAYFLSREACQYIAATPNNGDWMDERFVATVLAYNGIYGHTDLQNFCVTGPHLSSKEILANPTLAKGTIYCEYGPAQMHELHAGLKDVQPIWPQPQPQPVPEVFVTVEQMYAGPADTIPEGKNR
jgi:hypothetical protein